MNIKIEKGIPIPTHAGKPGYMSVIKAMEIGDSIILPRKTQFSLTRISRDANVKLRSRSISETEIRVWRVA